jgi:hypothetical protein
MARPFFFLIEADEKGRTGPPKGIGLLESGILEGVVEEIAECGGGGEGAGSGPAWNVEGGGGVRIWRVGARGVMGAERVADDAAGGVLRYEHALVGVDEKTLAANGAADR